jgi:hypothetical protein
VLRISYINLVASREEPPSVLADIISALSSLGIDASRSGRVFSFSEPIIDRLLRALYVALTNAGYDVVVAGYDSLSRQQLVRLIELAKSDVTLSIQSRLQLRSVQEEFVKRLASSVLSDVEAGEYAEAVRSILEGLSDLRSRLRFVNSAGIDDVVSSLRLLGVSFSRLRRLRMALRSAVRLRGKG